MSAVRRVTTGHYAQGRAVLSGRIELELSDGVATILYPSEVAGQRGIIHRWRNPSEDEIARILFVPIAPARTVDGAPLPEVHSVSIRRRKPAAIPAWSNEPPADVRARS